MTMFIVANCLMMFRPVFSYDESYTIAMARNSFSNIVRITANDVHAPLYYFMVKIISILLGGSVYAGRLLSLLCIYATLICDADNRIQNVYSSVIILYMCESFGL